MEPYEAEWLGCCRACGSRHDHLGGLNGTSKPVAGALNLCIVCGEMSVVEETALGFTLRELTDAELARASRSANVQAAIAALQKTWRRLGPPPSAMR